MVNDGQSASYHNLINTTYQLIISMCFMSNTHQLIGCIIYSANNTIHIWLVGNAVFALYLSVVCPHCTLISYKTYLLVKNKETWLRYLTLLMDRFWWSYIHVELISFLTYMSNLLEIMHETLHSWETWVCFETNRT